jgi:hypothetical protein
VSPAEPAARILAACSGVTLTLIQQPPAERDLGLSERMSESVLATITNEPTDRLAGDPNTMRQRSRRSRRRSTTTAACSRAANGR